MIMLALGCQNSKMKKDSSENLNEFKSNFFPEISKNILEYSDQNDITVIFPYALFSDGYSGIFFEYCYNITDFNTIVVGLEKSKKIKSVVQDSTIFYVPNFKIDDKENKYPIPNFKQEMLYLDDRANSKHKNIIYILKKEKGRYFNKKGIAEVKEYVKLKKNEVIGKGFCKGALVDFDKRKIIYWVIIW